MATLPSPLTAPLGGATALAIGDYAANIINDAAVEVGLLPRADPYDDVDANFIQLCRLLKTAGRELERLRRWTHLTQEYTFTTTTGVSVYDLPPDFRNMIDQTGWDRTNRLPLGGPLSPQEWQYLKGQTVGVVFTVLFRPLRQQLYLYPDTNIPVGREIAFEYESAYWVRSSGASYADKDAPTLKDDIVLFDPLLAVRALKLAFLKAKGYDTTAAQDDYERAASAVMAEDAPSQILSLNRGRGTRLLGAPNIPVTGFGS